jgi:hypothetical protein
MMKLRMFLVVAAATFACKSKEPSPSNNAPSDSPPSAPVAGAPGEPAAPVPANMSGPRPRKSANCPSMIEGADTKLTMTPLGVDVTITSGDQAVQRQIQSLSEFHARGVTSQLKLPHSGHHGGNGEMGYCPIIVSDQTSVTTTTVAGGVTLHVNARAPSGVKDLQTRVRQRARLLPGYLSS